ncbi:MAG: O-methyltransferase [Actinomycetota bacterium]
MAFANVHPKVEQYLMRLASIHDEEVLLDMEKRAADNGFPIVGRLCGMYLEQMARSIGARRIFELGSGYGYSAYWFARAIGPDGEIHLTDSDPENERMATDYLKRAGLLDPITFHVGDALEAFESVQGEFDIVYCDIDKHGYPEAWHKARHRIRVGGLYLCDNMLAGGSVTGDPEATKRWEGYREAIMETNDAIFNDPDYLSVINPTRDGVVAALRLR